MTLDRGTHEMGGTLMYAPSLGEQGDPVYRSPFRPSKIGPFPVRAVEVTPEDIWIITDGGTIRIPPQMAGYSWRP